MNAKYYYEVAVKLKETVNHISILKDIAIKDSRQKELILLAESQILKLKAELGI